MDRALRRFKTAVKTKTRRKNYWMSFNSLFMKHNLTLPEVEAGIKNKDKDILKRFGYMNCFRDNNMYRRPDMWKKLDVKAALKKIRRNSKQLIKEGVEEYEHRYDEYLDELD